MRMCFLLGLQLHAQNLLALSCISNYVSLQLRMVLIKCCDISNEVRPTDVAEPWVDCLLEEYFIQVPQCKQFLFTSALKMNMVKSVLLCFNCFTVCLHYRSKVWARYDFVLFF